MRFPFESAEAQLLNKQIFETIYYAALESSCELAAEFGTYETYPGSPVSKGVSEIKFCVRKLDVGLEYAALIVSAVILQILQHDMWDVTPTDLLDWKALKEKIAK